MSPKRKIMCLAMLSVLGGASAACDSESTPGDTSGDDAQGDTPIDSVDVPLDVPDTHDAADTADGEECMPVPPGCIDSCRNEEGEEALTLGVSARRCRVVTAEDGCPELEFTDESCGEGTCVWGGGVEVECVAPVDCESAACTCPDDRACTCGVADCAVTCEGDCIVTLSGTDGSVACAAGAECRTACSGATCTTSCAEGGACSQTCDGTDCALECDGASECVQTCNVDPSACTCNGCA